MRCRAAHCVYEVDSAWDVCGVCWDWRTQMLSDMPWIWQRVHMALVPSGRTALRERVTTTAPGSSIPLRTGPLFALEYAMIQVGVWTDTLKRLGFRFEQVVGPEQTETDAFRWSVHFLRMFDGKLAGTALAGDYYLDIYKAYWTLARVDNSRADAVRVPESCPACDRRTLIERHAGEYVQCLTCARTWSQAALAKETR